MSTLKEAIRRSLQSALEPYVVVLRDRFEGKEAIYVEKGASRVRINKIRMDLIWGGFSAEVEEIPTSGFPGLGYHPATLDLVQLGRRNPYRWRIGGNWAEFSEHCWYMGYGGWSLFFDPRIVKGVVDLASRFSDNTPLIERYKQIIDFLLDHHAYERGEPGFGSP